MRLVRCLLSAQEDQERIWLRDLEPSAQCGQEVDRPARSSKDRALKGLSAPSPLVASARYLDLVRFPCEITTLGTDQSG